MNRKAFAIFSALLVTQLTAAPFASAAGKYVYIDDVSKLKYQMGSDGSVWFRNLNEFDGSVTGCCYAFYLNTTTPYGRSAWALILSKMALATGLYVYVSETNPPTSGNPASIDQVGNW
jgi:hypothetical protein